MRYLTKSRFKLSLDCASKLYYTRKEEVYPNQMQVDKFLKELAKGGFQVGELAKFYHGIDPIAEDITITAKPSEYDLALAETNKRLAQPGRVLIAEAAFLYQNCYIRADIVVKEKNAIELYEVKAKSWSDEAQLTNKNGEPSSKWSEYLYDVAFQKWVIQKSTGLKVKAFLTVVNKDAIANVPGLGNHFKVYKNANGEIEVKITPGLKAEALGDSILINLPVDDVCDYIFSNPVKNELGKEFSFEAYIDFVSEHYRIDKKIVSPISSGCKKCEFFLHKDQIGSNKKSGVKECWVGSGLVTENEFDTEPLVTELWGGFSGRVNPSQKLMDAKIFLLKNGKRQIFDPSLIDGADGFENHERRGIQINKARDKDTSPTIATKELTKRISEWNFPLHFIDFETSMIPLPWYVGRRPYEGIAFQFSHHVIEPNGSIRHKGQFLSFEPGVFPNFNFVRALKADLEADNGTIFRYHSHENTYLRMIHRQLGLASISVVPDKEVLMNFIDTITHFTVKVGNKNIPKAGDRDMVDLFEVVLKCYYSPHAKGSNSLKQILPAVIHDFPVVKEKYSKAIYGKQLEVTSLNYDKHIWITPDNDFDPYKTLGPVFVDYSQDELDKLLEDMEGLADGGTAMMAFNMLQIADIPLGQREAIKSALLRYCELDTMAMVMLYEGLHSATVF